MRYNITALFFCIDEFCKAFEEWEKHRLIDTGRKRHRSCEMSLSEMLTIMVVFHVSPCKVFKYFYIVYGDFNMVFDKKYFLALFVLVTVNFQQAKAMEDPNENQEAQRQLRRENQEAQRIQDNNQPQIPPVRRRVLRIGGNIQLDAGGS